MAIGPEQARLGAASALLDDDARRQLAAYERAVDCALAELTATAAADPATPNFGLFTAWQLSSAQCACLLDRYRAAGWVGSCPEAWKGGVFLRIGPLRDAR